MLRPLDGSKPTSRSSVAARSHVRRWADSWKRSNARETEPLRAMPQLAIWRSIRRARTLAWPASCATADKSAQRWRRRAALALRLLIVPALLLTLLGHGRAAAEPSTTVVLVTSERHTELEHRIRAELL